MSTGAVSSSVQNGDPGVVGARSWYVLVSAVGSAESTAVSGTSISVRVYSRIELVGDVGVMRAGIAGSVSAETANSSPMSTTSVSIGIHARVKLVGNIGVVRTSGVGRVCSVATGCVTAQTAMSVSVRVNTRVELVSNVGVVGTRIGGCVVVVINVVRSKSKRSASSVAVRIVDTLRRSSISV